MKGSLNLRSIRENLLRRPWNGRRIPGDRSGDDAVSKDNYETDYARVVPRGRETHLLPGSYIEIVREIEDRPVPRHVLFDFDGTLSLVREGWPEVMVPMMVEVLSDTGTSDTDS